MLVISPCLNSAVLFMTLLTDYGDTTATINELQCTVKFMFNKVLSLGVAVGNSKLAEDNLFVNIKLSINFTLSSRRACRTPNPSSLRQR